MFRIALIALALALAACASEQGRNPLPVLHADSPMAIICADPGPKPRNILVPAGKKPTDFCPATAITYHPPYHLPTVNDAAAPADLPQDNETPGQPP